MAQLTRYRPFGPLTTFRREMDRLFSDFFGSLEAPEQGESAVWAPRMDLAEHDEAYVIRLDLPGVAKDDVHVDFQEGVLAIRGERKQEKTEEKQNFHRMERFTGSFYRSCRLPQHVQADDIKASFENGVLEVRVPKTEAQQPKRIEIS